MSTFKENESYKHKMAKEVLKEWLYGGGRLGEISFTPNRECGVLFEYPITKNSLETLWDEMGIHPKITDDMSIEKKQEIIPREYVPTYDECISMGIYPKRVIDVVLVHKGQPRWFIEIVHTNPVSQEKINELEMLGVKGLIEIEAEWIMKQTKMPTELKYKVLIPE
jgi:hypothetical protein